MKNRPLGVHKMALPKDEKILFSLIIQIFDFCILAVWNEINPNLSQKQVEATLSTKIQIYTRYFSYF